jgi:hypothetical protein
MAAIFDGSTVGSLFNTSTAARNRVWQRRQRGIVRHAGLDPASSFGFRIPAFAGTTGSRQAAGNVPTGIQRKRALKSRAVKAELQRSLKLSKEIFPYYLPLSSVLFHWSS